MSFQKLTINILLHNVNFDPSILVAHPIIFKGDIRKLKFSLSITVQNDERSVFGDFIVTGLLMGQQAGFTKFLLLM